MDPSRAARPADDAVVVAYLRDRAPGVPAVVFDPGTVTSRARRALRLRRRRRRTSVAVAAGAMAAYLALAVAGPLPSPGGGTMTVPGSGAVRAAVARFVPGGPPGPGQWRADVAGLDKEVRPVVERLRIFYLMASGPCHVLEYPHGIFRDGGRDCGDDPVPFDAQARADYAEVTRAVRRSGVAVERIYLNRGGTVVQIQDRSREYNWAYVYLPDRDSAPEQSRPDEQWTHVSGHWWFLREFDD
ncbi:hypothetical protein ACFO1B_16965 [Dactylosporangium siamense]|uniref:hypothetical protein n=1 Tax=Dactylosporangium siamense TaxID=685454 RepID=UPI001940422B|nr:hypothetical protein [Dactylosporangium siamense]